MLKTWAGQTGPRHEWHRHDHHRLRDNLLYRDLVGLWRPWTPNHLDSTLFHLGHKSASKGSRSKNGNTWHIIWSWNHGNSVVRSGGFDIVTFALHLEMKTGFYGFHFTLLYDWQKTKSFIYICAFEPSMEFFLLLLLLFGLIKDI